MPAPIVDILMYHSIADAEGATSIAPEIFAAQMAAIAEIGAPVISLDDYLQACEGRRELDPYSIIITFDDGFRDFSQNACPILDRYGFSAIVYLPTDAVGRCEDWPGAHTPPRQLMSWHEIMRHHEAGIQFGSHTVSHSDLNTLTKDALAAELSLSRLEIEERLGTRVQHFAPPYGHANRDVQKAIAKGYKTSVGTRLGSASLSNDVMDLPRLEMFYFTDINRWRSHLQGRGRSYLAARKVMRSVRQKLLDPWQ